MRPLCVSKFIKDLNATITGGKSQEVADREKGRRCGKESSWRASGAAYSLYIKLQGGWS